MKMTIKCCNCGEEAIYVKDEGSEKLGGYAFDCPNCGADMLVPKDNPKIKIVEE